MFVHRANAIAIPIVDKPRTCATRDNLALAVVNPRLNRLGMGSIGLFIWRTMDLGHIDPMARSKSAKQPLADPYNGSYTTRNCAAAIASVSTIAYRWSK